MKKSKEIKPYKRKDRNKWGITYRLPGYEKVFNESFDTEEEANLRAAEINFLSAQGTLMPPIKEVRKKPLTLGEFLDEYVSEYGSTHWGDSQYSVVTKQIRDYVKPSPISKLLIKDIQQSDLDRFYNKLLASPGVVRKGHKKVKPIGKSVVEKLHSTLKAAFNQAIRWGYIEKNPASNVKLPNVSHNKRKVWTPEIALLAIAKCKSRILKICILLAIGCSMRIGEILGLQWDCVRITEESIKNGTSMLEVKQELKRCEKSALDATKLLDKILFVFPPLKKSRACKTVLVIKEPKTETSKRLLYIPNSIARELMKLKSIQDEEKRKGGESYNDYGLVIAWPDGRPYEERLIAKEFRTLIDDNDLPVVVFHSLRHLSTSMKLRLSGGDIKAVQGDTGHSQPAMVTDVYGHTFDSDRLRVAQLMDSEFFDPDSLSLEKSDKEQQVLAILAKKPELTDMIIALGKTM